MTLPLTPLDRGFFVFVFHAFLLRGDLTRQVVLTLAAALTFASVPLTYALIMPINNRLKAIKDAKASGTVSAQGKSPPGGMLVLPPDRSPGTNTGLPR